MCVHLHAYKVLLVEICRLWFVESPPDFMVFVIPWIVLQELDRIKDNRYQRLDKVCETEIIHCFRKFVQMESNWSESQFFACP